jgi:thiamine-phosphate pyrophosphorylase
MLILITPDNIEKQHISTLQNAIEEVDKLHIKISETINFLDIVKRFLSEIAFIEDLKNKIVLHINENNLQLNHHFNIKNSLSEKFLKSIESFEKLGISNFHLSEKLFTDYLPIIPNDFFHQYNISVSLHHLKLNEQHNFFSYILYGPVFSSISKVDYHPKKSLDECSEELKDISETTDIPVIAVGGITSDNFQNVIQCGFAGVAIRGYIWNSNNPEEKLQEFLKQWNLWKGR